VFFNKGTTERIFESRDFLYDLFVNDAQLKASLGDSQKHLLKLNATDKSRFEVFFKKIKYYKLCLQLIYDSIKSNFILI
jgi:hypothetical protein